MSDDAKQSGAAGHAAGRSAPIWLIGWLFTVAFAQLSFWKAVLAILVWPYFLGVALR